MSTFTIEFRDMAIEKTALMYGEWIHWDDYSMNSDLNQVLGYLRDRYPTYEWRVR